MAASGRVHVRPLSVEYMTMVSSGHAEVVERLEDFADVLVDQSSCRGRALPVADCRCSAWCGAEVHG